MANEPDEDDTFDESDRSVDELARRAGAALRRPAPPDGMARIHAGRRRRAAVRVVGAGALVIVVAVGAFVALARRSDDAVGVSDTVATTAPADTAPATTAPATTAPATTAPGTTAPATTATATIATASGWRAATGDWSPLAYLACCGTNWEGGEPSPTVPSDPTVPLAAGLYNVRTVDDAPLAGDAEDGRLVLEVRPYVRCNELGELECEGGGPYADTELGVPNAPARIAELPLDETVRVEIHGFGCDEDTLRQDRQTGSGADLRALFTEFDASYQAAIAAPLRAGVDPEQLIAGISADPVAGFHDPGCPAWTSLAWTPSAGPTIITAAPFTRSAATAAGAYPTALRVDPDGSTTLYVYAGFSS